MILNLLFSALTLFAAEPTTKIINDAWYTMKSGGTPWGTYHETIEERGDRVFYRYNMTKVETGFAQSNVKTIVRENIGAVANLDLTPVSFNLNKSGAGPTETIDGSYSSGGPEKSGPEKSGMMSIKISGARVEDYTTPISKGVILDVFFPLWLKRNWEKLKPGYKASLFTFSEDGAAQKFRSRQVQIEVLGRDQKKNCLNIEVNVEREKAHWCMESTGSLVFLKMGNYLVERVKSEAETKTFLKAVKNEKE